MLYMTREGPYLILGNKGKLVAWTLHRFYVLKLIHPLLYDDDTICDVLLNASGAWVIKNANSNLK